MKLKLVYREIRNFEYLINLDDGYDWDNLSSKAKHSLIQSIKDDGPEDSETPEWDDTERDLKEWDIIK